MKWLALSIAALFVGVLPLAADQAAAPPAGSGEIVFVNELENQMGFDYYTAFLVYLRDTAHPLKVDPSGRFVRMTVPAGTYGVTHIGMYTVRSNDLYQYFEEPPFSIAVTQGQRVLFPYAFVTKLIKGTSPGSYLPIIQARKLAPAEITADSAELDKALRAKSAAVLPPRPLEAFLQVLAAPPPPAVAFQQDTVPFADFAAEKGIKNPHFYEGDAGEYFFPTLTVTDAATRTVTLGGYIPRKGVVTIDWGEGRAFSYSNGKFEPSSVVHSLAPGLPVRAVIVRWSPLEGRPMEMVLFADLTAAPFDAAAAGSVSRRSTLPDGTTLVVMDWLVQLVTKDPDKVIRDELIAGDPVPAFVKNTFGDPFDFVLMFPLRAVDGMPPGRTNNVRNDVKGIGLPLFGDPAMGSVRTVSRFANLSNMQSAWTLIGHEIMHTFANFVVKTDNGGHWGYSTANSLLGGMDPATLVDLGGGRYRAQWFTDHHNWWNPYGEIELYLMGMAAPSEVKPIRVFDGVTPGESSQQDLTFRAKGSHIVTMRDIIKAQGPRVPAYPNAPRSFRAIALVITDTELSPVELEPYLASVHYFSSDTELALNPQESLLNFKALTRGRGSISLDGLLTAFDTAQAAGGQTR
jgi:hypothetical protein